MFTVSEGEKRRLVFSRNLAENEAFNKETIAFGNEGGVDTKKTTMKDDKECIWGSYNSKKGHNPFATLKH